MTSWSLVGQMRGLEYLPAVHWLHSELVVTPKAEEYFPAGHDKQVESVNAFRELEYFPAGHERQKLSAGLVDPVITLPLGQKAYFPAEQKSHAEHVPLEVPLHPVL